MALAVNRTGVILEKYMSNHRPESAMRCAAGTCQHTCPANTNEKCPHRLDTPLLGGAGAC